MNPDARVFIAGDAGLIGSAMKRRLQREGHRQLLTRSRSQLDLQDGARVTEFFRETRPDYVVLAAGRVGGIIENQTVPADFMDANLSIQLNVLKAAREIGASKVILFGSSCMYPRETAQPMNEAALLTGKPEPSSLPYAISKLAGTYSCLAYNAQLGQKKFLPVIPNSAYGPNDNFDPLSGHVLGALISRFHQAKLTGAETVTLWGTGSPRREFVHADDIAGACLQLERDVSQLEFPVNIGVDSDMSIRELAAAVADVVEFAGRVDWDETKPDGAPRKLLDSSRMKAFGWAPQVSFRQGLSETYAWYVRSISDPVLPPGQPR